MVDWRITPNYLLIYYCLWPAIVKRLGLTPRWGAHLLFVVSLLPFSCFLFYRENRVNVPLSLTGSSVCFTGDDGVLIYRIQVQKSRVWFPTYKVSEVQGKRFFRNPCSTIQSENEIATRANTCLSVTPITLQSIKMEWDLRKSLAENEDSIIHHFTPGRNFLFLCLLFDCCCSCCWVLLFSVKQNDLHKPPPSLPETAANNFAPTLKTQCRDSPLF